jgi:Flp pilus assembly protein TadD
VRPGPSSNARERARACFESAEFAASRAAAIEALHESPDDVELLLLAGRAGLEIDAEDAIEKLRRATQLAPDDARAWHHFGEALVTDGRTDEADAAFRRAVELDPDDNVALTHLGHTSLAAGREEEGLGYLTRAAATAPGASSASISLVEMYRSVGEYDQALQQARLLADAGGDDLLAWLDVAELSVQLGRLDEAVDAFARLRDFDDVPGREAYPLHGMIQVEVRRRHWADARHLAAQAAAIDPRGLSTDLAAFLDDQISGSGDATAPSAAEVDAALASSLDTYRQMLSDQRTPAADWTL